MMIFIDCIDEFKKSEIKADKHSLLKYKHRKLYFRHYPHSSCL